MRFRGTFRQIDVMLLGGGIVLAIAVAMGWGQDWLQSAIERILSAEFPANN